MSPDLDNALCRDFPLLYAQRGGSPSETNMCWGFPGDGWEPLIRRLSLTLSRLASKEPDPTIFQAVQVKEKYGTLRFYMSSATDAMYNAIDAAERASAKTCESCGKPGRLRGGGWLFTQCDDCAGLTSELVSGSV